MPSCLRAFPHAFTLVEILITLAIIVLILAIAIPAVSLLTGDRSIEGTQNQISAELNLARARAQSLQREGGLIFLLDPASDRIAMRHVVARTVAATALGIASDRAAQIGTVRIIDFMAEADPVLLPGGVAMQFLHVGDQDGGFATNHRYTGFNRLPGAGDAAAGFGGVVLFDAQGRVLTTSVWFHESGALSALADVLDIDGNTIKATPYPGPVRSQVGFVLVDRTGFIGQFDLGEDPTNYGDAEQREEQWLDDNARLLLLNRYNGTFVQ